MNINQPDKTIGILLGYTLRYAPSNVPPDLLSKVQNLAVLRWPRASQV
jgi:hypothetical protein